MSAILSPCAIQKFFDNNGRPLANGLLFTYIAGTSTKVATFIDAAGITQNTNPIVLDARGECNLWLTPGQAYKLILSPKTDTDPPTDSIWTVDNIVDPFSQAVWDALGFITDSLKIKYDQTPAELAAGVTPVNFYIPSHDVVGYVIVNRYGNNTVPGTTDMLTAENNAQAVAAQISNGAKVVYLAQNYFSSDVVNISSLRVSVEGQGKWATTWSFNPGSAKARFKIQNSNTASIIYQCAFRKGAFDGAGTNQKIALDCYDVSELLCEEIAVKSSWTGSTSIGIRTHGRELTTFRQLDIYADRPVHIVQNANATTLSADHFHFEDCILHALISTEGSLVVDANAGMASFSMAGYISMSGGKYGIYSPSGTSVATCLGVNIENLRYEQPADNTGHAIHWEMPTISFKCDTVNFGGSGSPTNGGIYLRNVLTTELINTLYTGLGEAMNADSTNGKITTHNCFWQGGSTATLTGLMTVTAEPNTTSGPVPENGMLMPSSFYQEIRDDTLSGNPITLSAGNTAQIGLGSQLGVITVTDESTQVVGTFFLKGTNHATVLGAVSDAGFFSATAHNANTINCYWDGSSHYVVENGYGVSKTIRVSGKIGRT